jgi:hypothetical protein
MNFVVLGQFSKNKPGKIAGFNTMPQMKRTCQFLLRDYRAGVNWTVETTTALTASAENG